MSHKPKQPIKQLLKDHYSEQQLEPDQLAKLLEMQSQASISSDDPALSATSSWHKWRLPRAVLSACVLILAVGLWTAMSPTDNSRDIVEEIASNHLQPLQLDVGSSSLEEVGRNLSHLSFSLIKSARMESKQWKLLGGRYCTIQGQLAAQLKLLNKQNQKIVTLYQSAIQPKSNSSFHEKTLLSDAGVEVSIWWEDDVMLALAQ